MAISLGTEPTADWRRRLAQVPGGNPLVLEIHGANSPPMMVPRSLKRHSLQVRNDRSLPYMDTIGSAKQWKGFLHFMSSEAK